ncbi:MAG: transcription termination/antitermination NusG family protein [Phycisphaerae bacterium]
MITQPAPVVPTTTSLQEPTVETLPRHGLAPTVDFAPLAGAWWVLHTRARNEKAVASALEKNGVPHYLPLVRLKRTYGGRAVHVSLPLFPGYLFMNGGESERYAALRTNRVANVIAVADQSQFVSELRQIIRVVESEHPVDLYPSLREGCRCRVVSGSLKGIEGVVLRRKNVSRMYIAATVLGQSAVIEIDNALLEPAD